MSVYKPGQVSPPPPSGSLNSAIRFMVFTTEYNKILDERKANGEPVTTKGFDPDILIQAVSALEKRIVGEKL